MNEAEKSDDLETRLTLLVDYLTDYVYQNICRTFLRDTKEHLHLSFALKF